MKYKLIITVTSEALAELIEYTAETPGATVESVAKDEASNGNGEALVHNLGPGVDPRLVMKSHPDHPGQPSKNIIDVEASLRNIGLTREQLLSRPTQVGSIEHRIKRADNTQGRKRKPRKVAA